MSEFFASPVWGAILTVGGTAILAVFGLIWRISSKVDRLGDKLDALGKDMAEFKEDPNIVRWSDMNSHRMKRRRHDI